MPNLQIRDLPQDVYDALKVDAEIEHRSLTQQAIMALRQAQKQRIGGRAMTIQVLRESGRKFDFADDSPEVLIAEDRAR